jgi:hypothetical protein
MGHRVMFVEGKDDEHVVKHLCRAYGVDPIPFEIRLPKGEGAYDEGGVEQLLDQIVLTLKSQREIDRLAVVLDADSNIESRWRQLRDRQEHFEESIGIPASPDHAGTILDFDLQTRTLRFGVWIMPDNRLSGMLEDFLAWLVPDNDTMLPRVDAFPRAIPQEERLFRDTHLAKVRIHTFLAVQKEPGKPLGLAITCRYLDAKKEDVVSPFLDWLRTVLID